jgi:radical SAM protein with 4Fe4S-binding SPASM domain
MPATYSIEPTNYCNLKCPECPSGLGILTRPLGMMNFNDFKKIIDEICLTGFYIQLFFQGEPFLNKELPQMIGYARKKNIYVSISTNGHFINEKNAENVLLNPPDKLIFSIDGLDEESYKNYRIGGSFKKADEGLRMLMEKRNELKMKIPFVELQYIVMKQNEHLINNVLHYGKEVGVNKVVLKTMQVTSYENALKFLPENENFRRYKIDAGEVKIKSRLKNYCFALWRTSVITWDGKIVPCCFDKDASYELGSLNRKNVSDIWNSDNYFNFRSEIFRHRKKIKMCTNCTEGLKVNILEV